MVKLEFCRLSPVMLLVLFTTVNVIVFLDRGTLAAVVNRLKKNSDGGLGLNSFEAGALGSLFIFGYMVASPIFAYYSQTVHPQYLMSIGLTIWTAAVLFCGVSNSFYLLAAARAITGVGEASFVCLAPPCILDSAPPEKRTMWIGIFYSATPLGYALGFVYGNQVSSMFNDWHYPFIIEMFMMVPFILISLLSYKDPKFYAKKEDGEKEKITTQISILLKNILYVSLILGYSSYAFTIGGLGFWGPDFVESFYDVSGSVATYSLGAVTVFCGIVGTGCGSFFLTYMMRKFEEWKNKDLITNEQLEFVRVEKSCILMPFGIFIGMITATFGTVLSVAFSKPMNFIVYLIGLVVGEFFIFLTISPTAMAIMMCVPNHLRGQANAVSVFVMHALGDFPSPAVIGAWFDAFGSFVGMILTAAWLIIAVIFWTLAWNIARFHGAPWSHVSKNFCKRRTKSNESLIKSSGSSSGIAL